MFNLALQRLGNHAEAATWMRYLKRDRTSQWAERAKRALILRNGDDKRHRRPPSRPKQQGDLDFGRDNNIASPFGL
jgi:hypothetical protein